MTKIWVASSSDYNAGNLHGVWIDLGGVDKDEVMEQIAALLRDSKHPNVTVDCPDCDGTTLDPDPNDHDLPICKTCGDTGKVQSAEEWAIHDHEGFYDIKLGEHESIEYLCELADALEDHGEPYAIWHANENRDDVDVDAFQEQYRGKFDSLEDWAYEFLDDTGTFGKDVPDILKTYFDFKAYARDCEMGGDIWSETDSDGNVLVFDNH